MEGSSHSIGHQLLEGLRVIDLGIAIAGPFAATMLGDFGADVIKVERRAAGDPARRLGMQKNGVPIWWKVAGRNKRSITLDFTTERGREALLRLIAKSDVVVENFRPGTLERHQLGWDVLHALNPRLVMLRVSGYGQFGPKSSRPGFGRVAEAMSGAAHLIGEKDGPPMLVGYSLADELAGLFGAFGVLAVLLSRIRTGQGDCIDLALYEPSFRFVDWQVSIYEQLGIVPIRAGNTLPDVLVEGVAGGMARSCDGTWMAYSAATDSVATRLIRLVLGSAALDEPRFATPQQRRVHVADIQKAVNKWVSERSASEVEAEFERSEAVIAPVYDVSDIMQDETYRARGNIVSVPDPDFGQISMPAPTPLVVGAPGAVRWTGPSVGQHTDEVLTELAGYSAEEVRELRKAGVV